MTGKQQQRQRARDSEYMCYTSQLLHSKVGLRNLILLDRLSHHEDQEESMHPERLIQVLK